MSKTLAEIDSSLILLRGEVKKNATRIEEVNDNNRGALTSKLEVSTLSTTLNGMITDLETRIGILEERYSTIVSPTETKYYMSQADIDQLRLILRRFDTLYTEIISAQANMVTMLQRAVPTV